MKLNVIPFRRSGVSGFSESVDTAERKPPATATAYIPVDVVRAIVTQFFKRDMAIRRIRVNLQSTKPELTEEQICSVIRLEARRREHRARIAGSFSPTPPAAPMRMPMPMKRAA